MRPSRRAEAGLLHSVAAVVAALAVLVVALGAFTYIRMTGTPDLGQPPQGPAHGDSEVALATYAVRELVPLLRPGGGGHATVALSEQDLTAEARLRAGNAVSDPEVRVRDGLLVVSGKASVLGVGVTAVGHLKVRLSLAADGLPDVGVDIDSIDAGNLTLPGFLRDAIAQQIKRQVQLDSLLSADPNLRALRGQMECVAVGRSGLVLGFHQPFTSAEPNACDGK